MSPPSLSVGLVVAGTGLALALAAVLRSRRFAVDLVEVLEGGGEPAAQDEFQRKLTEPLSRRVGQGLAQALGRFERLLPGNYVEGVQRKLQLAGSTTTAGEFLAVQGGVAVGLGLLALAFLLLGRPPLRIGVLALVGLPLIGAMFPAARLSRKVKERTESIRKDLPDTLDLLAISVEAGMGFEGALDVVCQYFKSPLADEFSLTLREMELGLARREAFQNLKARSSVPELSNFILALIQADALGMPIGRVLKTQAAELRMQRRMWAREKAGKMPVKILFPLVLFIFPPVMAVVLGPAMSSLAGQGL